VNFVITIEALAPVSRDFVMLGGAQFALGPAPSIFASIGDVFITVGDEEIPPIARTQLNPGWMKQGTDEWGELHDKEVTHLSAEGHLIITDGWLNSTTTDLEEIRYSSPTDRMVDWDGTSRLCQGIFPWGSDFRKVIHIYVPSLRSSIMDATMAAHMVSFTTEVRFDKDKARYERIRHTPSRTWIPDDPLAKPWTEPGVDDCAMCFLWKEDNSVSQKVHRTSWIFSDMYGGPTGTIARLNVSGTKVPKSRIGIDGGVLGLRFFEEIPKHASDPKGTAADVLFQFDRVVADLAKAKYTEIAYAAITSTPFEFEWGGLTKSICEQRNWVDANVLLLAFDLIRGKELIDQIGALAKKVVSDFPKLIDSLGDAAELTFGQFERLWHRSLDVSKDAANVTLLTKYGVQTTAGDLGNVVQSLLGFLNKEANTSRLHSRAQDRQQGTYGFVDAYYTLTAQVAILPDTFCPVSLAMKSIEFSKRAGYYPSLAALKDFIPFEFVLGWFTDFVSTPTKTADLAIDKQYFPLSYAMQTVKKLWTMSASIIDPDNHYVSGEILWSLYDRKIITELPLPPYVGDGWGPGVSEHWTEGTALVVQRIKH